MAATSPGPAPRYQALTAIAYRKSVILISLAPTILRRWRSNLTASAAATDMMDRR
jgi:hypothetical protein